MRSVIQRNSIRNVMDMNSNLGGFAAALKDKDVWVMNVAPVNASDKLKIVYDRGLIGTVHDWYIFYLNPNLEQTCELFHLIVVPTLRLLIHTSICRCESFSTYPRTYDLLHAWSVFSEITERGCSSEDLLIEMDRVLRPEGLVIIRDKPSVINHVHKFLASLQWDKWSSEVEPSSDALSRSEERVLIARKRLWEEI